MKILITGSSGFIGYHLSLYLLKKRYPIIGIDNLNSYYDVNLKLKRLKVLRKFKNFKFYKLDISNKLKLFDVFKNEKISIVINLAAQAGVRFSIDKPDKYLKSNIVGFFNILQACRYNKISKLYFASTSSVYGDKNKLPFSEIQNISQPLSFYSATKSANEIMAYSYTNLFGFRAVALRFFTVYGPYGRPDMAIMLFIKNILNEKNILLFNKGKHTRDFTYVEDVVKTIHQLILVDQKKKKSKNFEIFNIGSQKRISIKKIVKLIENITGKKANIKLNPKARGDMKDTFSNSSKIIKYTKYNKRTSIKDGLKKTISWYKKFYFN